MQQTANSNQFATICHRFIQKHKTRKSTKQSNQQFLNGIHK